MCSEFSATQHYVEMRTWFCERKEQNETVFCRRHVLFEQLRGLPRPAGVEFERVRAALRAVGQPGSWTSAANIALLTAFEDSKREYCVLPGKADLPTCDKRTSPSGSLIASANKVPTVPAAPAVVVVKSEKGKAAQSSFGQLISRLFG